MRFLAFVTNDAQAEHIIELLEEAGIAYDQKTAGEGTEIGHIFRVSEDDFDRADELLSVPEKDFAFKLIEENRLFRDEEYEIRAKRKVQQTKRLRRMALYMGVFGILYLIYAFITRA